MTCWGGAIVRCFARSSPKGALSIFEPNGSNENKIGGGTLFGVIAGMSAEKMIAAQLLRVDAPMMSSESSGRVEVRTKEYAQAALLLDKAGWVMNRPTQNGELKKGEWGLLRYLDDPRHHEPTTKIFAFDYDITAMHAVRISGALDRLGLIERFPDPGNTRMFRMKLTANGRKMLRKDPLLALAAALAKYFASDEFESQGEVLAKLLEALGARAIESGAGRSVRGAAGPTASASERGRSAAGDLIGDTESDAQDVALLIGALSDMVFKDSQSKSLSRNDWAALRYFQYAKDSDASLSDFASFAGVNLASASNITSKLTKLGLLNRKSSPEQGKAYVVSVTPKGFTELRSDPLENLKSILSATLSSTECQELSRLMKVVIDAYSDGHSTSDSADQSRPAVRTTRSTA